MNGISRPVLSTVDNYLIPFDGQELVLRFLAEEKDEYIFMEIGQWDGKHIKRNSPSRSKYERRRVLSLPPVQELHENGELKNRHRFVERALPDEIPDNPVSAGLDENLDRARIVLAMVFPVPEDEDPNDDPVQKLLKKQRYEQAFATRVKELVTDTPESRAVVSRTFNTARTMFPTVSRVSIRSWIYRHIFFGGHPNSCLALHKQKGGKGKPRADNMKNGKPINTGRKTDDEKQGFARKTYGRKRCLPHVRKRWFNYLKSVGSRSTKTMMGLARDFVNLAVASNKAGKDRSMYRILPKNLPTVEYLADLGSKELKRLRYERQKANGWNVGERTLAGGSSLSILDGEISVLDLDGTIPKNFIHVKFRGRNRGIRRSVQPTVLLAVDRRSSAIVGWYVTFGFENGNAYLSLLFSAFTDKTDDLARWGVSELKGMVYGFTSAIFVDRGPAVSEKVQKVAVGRLSLRTLMAEPGRGENKGGVEVRNMLMQRDLRELPGSYMPTGDAAADRARDVAIRKGAGVSLREYMQALLGFISESNLRVNQNILYTNELREAGIPQIPKNVYEFYQKKRRGDMNRAIAFDEDKEVAMEKIYKLLSLPHQKTTHDGYVTIAGRIYYSDELRDAALEHKLFTGKPMTVEILETPSRPLMMMWVRPSDQVPRSLPIHSDSLLSFDDTYRWMHDTYQQMKKSTNRNADEKKKENETAEFNARATKGMVSLEQEEAMRDTENNSTTHKGTNIPRRKARDLFKQQTDTDDAQHLLSKFRTGSGDIKPTTNSGRQRRVPAISTYDDDQDLNI